MKRTEPEWVRQAWASRTAEHNERIREGKVVAERNRLGLSVPPTSEALPGHCSVCMGRVYLVNLRWVDAEGGPHAH